MRAIIEKGRGVGLISAPPSKSMAHRLLIAAGLCPGVSVVHGVSLCEDALATMDCLRALGARIELSGEIATVHGIDPREAIPSGILGARESGSTLRFFIPIALLSGKDTTFSGAGRLMERPMTVYEDICRDFGMKFDRCGGNITVCGPIPDGDIYMPGNISSQFITGFLFILPYLKKDTRIHITTEIESRSYIEMTLEAMRSFGIDIGFENENTLLMRGGEYSPREVCVEGDWSGAAFPDALNLFGGEVKISGLNTESLQGDRVYRSLYKSLAKGYAEISIEDCPDLGPILFTLAAALNGGHFTGTARLRIKESDRAAVMAEELSKFGAELLVEENSVTVKKTELHSPKSTLSGHGDHRIVMALAILATLHGGEIDGAEAISKSYPAFFDDMRRLGIKITLN